MNEHPAALLFPLMADADLRSLAADIARNGLRDPLETLHGDLLDGRNRFRACAIAEVEPRFVEVDLGTLSPIEYVVSKNLHRRHLTTGQRAALALDLMPHLEAEAHERQVASLRKGVASPVSPEMDERGRADAKAAELVGVSRSTVAYAKSIQKRDPDVVDQMRSGEIPTVAGAARAAGFPSMGQHGAIVMPDTKTDALGRAQPTVRYGKGDKFVESTEPLRRYLASWSKRGFEFTHVNPKEARKRLGVLEEIAHDLELVRRDLESRSETARLSL